jgi:hypothetical protein
MNGGMDDEIELQGMKADFALRMIYHQAHMERVRHYLLAAAGGMAVLTILSLIYRGFDSDFVALIANFFGLATVTPTLAEGKPPVPPPDIVEVIGAESIARMRRMQTSMFYGSWGMVAFWFVLIAWRLYELVRA